MAKGKGRRRRIFISYFGSYLLALCIPVLVCSAAYTAASNRIAGNIERYTAASLNQMLAQMDAKLSDIQDVSYRVANDMLTQSTSLVTRADRSALAYGMTRYVKQLWPVWFTNNGTMSRMYVYFARSGEVASPFTFYDAEDFYGTFFRYDGMSEDGFYGSLMDRRNNVTYLEPAEAVLNDMESSKGRRMTVLFIRQIIPQNTSKPLGAVFSLIDSDWIESKLDSVLPSSGGYGAVMDSSGRVVAETGDTAAFGEEEIEGFRQADGTSTDGGNIVVSITSAQSGWKYVAAGRKSALMPEVDAIMRLFLSIIAVAIALGAAVCAWLANSTARPVARLTGLFDGGEAGGRRMDSFRLIESGIGRIMDSNRTLAERMESHKPLLASLFLHRLFSGDFGDEEDIPAVACEMGASIPDGTHVAVVARIRAGYPMSREEIIRAGYCKRIVHGAMEKASGGPLCAMDPSLTEVAFLYTARMPAEEVDAALSDELNEASALLREKGVSCLFAMGAPFERLSDAPRSYREALSAADWASPGLGVPLVWYWSLHRPGDQYEYRLETEERLISLIRGGRRESVHGILEAIRSENFTERSLTDAMKRMLIGELEATLVKAAEAGRNGETDRLLSDIDSVADLDARFDRVCLAMEESCSLGTAQRQSSSHHLALRIKECIDGQYTNPDLGLKYISAETGITEAYLSRVFKENIGDNFASYVERMRIEAACRLLVKPDCSVATVAEAVGYNSDHVFRRAFRRVTGLNPAEYRRGMGLE